MKGANRKLSTYNMAEKKLEMDPNYTYVPKNTKSIDHLNLNHWSFVYERMIGACKSRAHQNNANIHIFFTF